MLGGEELIDDALVREVKVSNPNPKNTLLSFKFEGRGFFALFDDIWDEKEVLRVFPNAVMELTGEDKFKGKTVFLARESILKKRLDVRLVELGLAKNRSRAVKMIKDDKVIVSGVKNVKASLLVGLNDEIKADSTLREVKKAVEMPVLYEDVNVVVINKPAGVLTHSKGEFNEDFTVADWLAEREGWGAVAGAAGANNRQGIVHRLDRDTSGVMVLGKNEATVKFLQKQFAGRKVKKVYFAVVDGMPKKDKAVIELPILRNPKRPTTFRVDVRGKAAVTAYEVVKSNGERSLLKLMPSTGRTHQLRVHLNYIGNPITGDKVYGDSGDFTRVGLVKRMMLHAGSLEITLPGGERRVFESKMPEEFLKYVS